jgi:hypothetical protein
MTSALVHLDGQGVKVRQKRELLQALVGLDVANRYEVSSKDGRPLFTALERGGLWNLLMRRFNPFYENVTECVAPGGGLVMKVVFPWALWFRKANVLGPGDVPLGRVKRRFHFFRVRADVFTPEGEVALRIRGPIFKFFFFTDWVFDVEQQGRRVAQIRKKWGGVISEAFTNADTFAVEFEPHFADPRLKLLLVAATMLLDLVRFEEKDKDVVDQVEGKSKEPALDD